jgi:outer membrane lipoprotein carrier protein
MAKTAFLASALLLLAAAAALPAAGAATSAPEAKPGMDRLHDFLEHVQSMRASFRQEIVNGNQEVIEEARGRMVLKRPGRFRWDYEQPYKRVVVADGERLWLYEADLEQVTVRPLAAGLGETPAALLTGARDVLDRFEYVSSSMADHVTWVRLKPRSADSDFESVAIGFTGEKLVQLELNDRLGQQTRLYLSDIEMNAKVADDTFRFQVPDGVDVIREGGL